MFQPHLFELPPDSAKPINVASVPQRSPFRYPGGKTWLVPYIRSWLSQANQNPKEFIEPFAGGGIISLTVAAEHLAEHVIMVELDEDVSAVWQTVLDGHAAWLGERIYTFNLTSENIDRELSNPPQTLHERAFQTILKNRVNHGGILAAGAGRIKEGEGGKGLLSRWYPETLRRRLIEIGQLQDHISFFHRDGLSVLEEHKDTASAVFFIDPPYTASAKKAGARLYRYFQLDHEYLFDLTQKVCGDFLMTYDNDEAVRLLAKRHGFDCEAIAMKNTHHAQLTELLIGRNLDWLRH
jgi:DNA adenine methylase